MYKRFTDRARKVMQLANNQARKVDKQFIDTEHILYGLAAEGQGVAANVLLNLNVDSRKLYAEVMKSLPYSVELQPPAGQLWHTPDAQKALEYALEEARSLSHSYVGTEHLLLGLMRLEEGTAIQILLNLGLKRSDVREETLRLLGQVSVTSKIPAEPEPNDVPTDTATVFPDDEEATPPANLTGEQKNLLGKWLDELHGQKVSAINSQDFKKASLLRDQAVVLQRLLGWYNWSQRST